MAAAAVETPSHHHSIDTIDTDRLSSFLDIDTPDLQSIVDSAAEGVIFLLQQIQLKAKEYEEITHAKDELEVTFGIARPGEVN